VIAASVPMAQTALATFLVYCGLFLVIFVVPPTKWWAGGDERSGDWRPTLLAVALMLAFLVIAAVPALRVVFALQPLERPYALLTIVALAAWLSLVRLFWRRRLLERFLGVDEKQ
jgi:cation-transporting ATPase E